MFIYVVPLRIRLRTFLIQNRKFRALNTQFQWTINHLCVSVVAITLRYPRLVIPFSVSFSFYLCFLIVIFYFCTFLLYFFFLLVSFFLSRSYTHSLSLSLFQSLFRVFMAIQHFYLVVICITQFISDLIYTWFFLGAVTEWFSLLLLIFQAHAFHLIVLVSWFIFDQYQINQIMTNISNKWVDYPP